MPYIRGESREQLTLTPMCLDDYVEADSICRVIAAYVGNLDMAALGFKYAEPANTGRPPHDPASMLMLYLYGYLNRIRSSRRLHAETKRNVEVMWLMEKVTPDDKTICNFRKDNAIALQKVFREFSLWCNLQGLYGRELVAVDGTKIRANSSWRNIHTLSSTKKGLEKIDKKITEYMNELETNDANETSEKELQSEAILEALKRLNEKKNKLNGLLEQLESGEFSEISTVDPDAHIMRQGGDGRAQDACYNIRAVVDSKNKLIVDFENSTCANDIASLSQSVESAKEILGVTEISAVADSGFYDGADFERCSEKRITCYVAKLNRGTKAPSKEYGRQNFKYDKANDAYICPQGEILPYKYNKKKNEPSKRVYGNIGACRVCPQRELCTTQKRGWREVIRCLHQDAEDEVDARMATAEGRRIMGERKKIVEHPFGTIKKVWGFNSFLCRSVEKTTAEVSLTFLAYNFRRTFNIFKESGKNLIEILA